MSRTDRFATGNADIDRDRGVLHGLLGRVIDIFCCDTASRDGDCRGCADAPTARCGEAIEAIAGELAALMNVHCARESALMRSLPQTQPIATLCARHRRAHAEFFIRHDAAVGRIDSRDLVGAARDLGTFLGEWLRRHTAEYDVALAGMIDMLSAGAEPSRAAPPTERVCISAQCAEVQRGSAEADRLRALLAQALDHVPAEHPLAAEGFAALN